MPNFKDVQAAYGQATYRFQEAAKGLPGISTILKVKLSDEIDCDPRNIRIFPADGRPDQDYGVDVLQFDGQEWQFGLALALDPNFSRVFLFLLHLTFRDGSYFARIGDSRASFNLESQLSVFGQHLLVLVVETLNDNLIDPTAPMEFRIGFTS
jgi:hypothetical protein